jgi:hypothetical protein
MIVREVFAASNQSGDQPACWALISQIEHARLAYDLATHWSELPLSDGLLSETVLPTIFHHDDGWAAWDNAPQVDPQSGRPLSFLEMPLAESLDIWTGSIQAVEPFGPLASWLVAEHFTKLLAPSHHAEAAIAKSWLAEQAAN